MPMGTPGLGGVTAAGMTSRTWQLTRKLKASHAMPCVAFLISHRMDHSATTIPMTTMGVMSPADSCICACRDRSGTNTETVK